MRIGEVKKIYRNIYTSTTYITTPIIFATKLNRFPSTIFAPIVRNKQEWSSKFVLVMAS